MGKYLNFVVIGVGYVDDVIWVNSDIKWIFKFFNFIVEFFEVFYEFIWWCDNLYMMVLIIRNNY